MTPSEQQTERNVLLLEKIMTIIAENHNTTLPKVSVTALQIIDYLEENEFLK
jgi:hypothetical protein